MVSSNSCRIPHYCSPLWIARCTVCRIVHETCSAIVAQLLNVYIKFPHGNQLDMVVSEFKRKWGIPLCIGAIDGCHIPISAPIDNHTDYYNRKGWYSMILQGVVDANYCFTDIYVGWPGSVHDARVFSHSPIYKQITEQELLPGNRTMLINSIEVPLYLIGDSASNSNLVNETFPT